MRLHLYHEHKAELEYNNLPRMKNSRRNFSDITKKQYIQRVDPIIVKSPLEEHSNLHKRLQRRFSIKLVDHTEKTGRGRPRKVWTTPTSHQSSAL